MKIENLTFEQLRELPLPQLTRDLSAFSEYRKIAIPQDSPFQREKLVNLSELGIAGVNFYHSVQNPPYFHRAPGAIPELLARETVARKLQQINLLLSRFELELFVFDAYRPIAVQRHFAEVWVPQSLRRQNPDKDEEWIRKEVSKYWSSAPSTLEDLERRPPPHSTGAAVDLTIRFKETQIPLEMGSLFDDPAERSHLRYYENRDTRDSFTESESRKNRRLFHHVMTHFEFASHPREWWHFSYGDQIWAFWNHKVAAHYGYAGDH